MAEFPAAGDFDEPITGAELIDAQEALLAASKQLPGAEAVSELTISGGVIVPTGSNHRVDTESNAAADDLSNIQATNVRDGAMLVLWPENITRVVTVKHAAGGNGQVYLRGDDDYAMDHDDAVLVLQLRGTLWREVARGERAEPVPGQQLFTATGTFTVPDNAITVYVTAVGGGGGGGGGAGTSGTNPNTANNGAPGSAGASSIFGASLVVALGGAGGAGGLASGLGGQAGVGGATGQNAAKGSGGQLTEGSMSFLGQYGMGGAGGAGAGDTGGAAGGGSGGSGGPTAIPKMRVPINVDGVASMAVTIGAGGAGGAGGTGVDNNGSDGDGGADGAILVEW